MLRASRLLERLVFLHDFLQERFSLPFRLSQVLRQDFLLLLASDFASFLSLLHTFLQSRKASHFPLESLIESATFLPPPMQELIALAQPSGPAKATLDNIMDDIKMQNESVMFFIYI